MKVPVISLNMTQRLMQREQLTGEQPTQAEIEECVIGESDCPKHILEKFHRTILLNQVNLEPEFCDVVNKNFWDLI